jgi:hypothetical protein
MNDQESLHQLDPGPPVDGGCCSLIAVILAIVIFTFVKLIGG